MGQYRATTPMQNVPLNSGHKQCDQHTILFFAGMRLHHPCLEYYRLALMLIMSTKFFLSHWYCYWCLLFLFVIQQQYSTTCLDGTCWAHQHCQAVPLPLYRWIQQRVSLSFSWWVQTAEAGQCQCQLAPSSQWRSACSRMHPANDTYIYYLFII